MKVRDDTSFRMATGRDFAQKFNFINLVQANNGPFVSSLSKE